MTRAKEELILLHGQKASPFLEEIPAGYVRWESAEKEEDIQTVQISLFDFI